jgi:SAM-dependent methyltransferase
LGLILFSFPNACSLAGFELSPSAVRGATHEAHRRGFKQTDLRRYVPGEAWPKEWLGRFDVVIASHVLEHLSQPELILEPLVKCLRSDGVMCIVVPINERPCEDLNHFSVFTEESLASLAERCGLDCITTATADRIWDVISPLAYAQQRRPSAWLRMMSLGVNSVTGLLPIWALNACDRVLGWIGFRERQLFALYRRKGFRLCAGAFQTE